MANAQLVEYIKDQISHKMDVNSLRTLLLQQGWQPEDVEEAIAEAYSQVQSGTHKMHHINFLAVAIVGIVVVILIVALLLIVFKETDPGPNGPEIPNRPISPPIPPDNFEDWELCSLETDSLAKDACYVAINEEYEDFDCDLLVDKTEQTFCYRAKEQVILDAYA